MSATPEPEVLNRESPSLVSPESTPVVADTIKIGSMNCTPGSPGCPTLYTQRVCPKRNFTSSKPQCDVIIPLGKYQYARCCNYALKGRRTCYVHRKSEPTKVYRCRVAVIDQYTGKQRCCKNTTAQGLKRKIRGRSFIVCSVHAKMIDNGKASELTTCSAKNGAHVTKGPEMKRKYSKDGNYLGFNIVSTEMTFDKDNKVLLKVTTGGPEGPSSANLTPESTGATSS